MDSGFIILFPAEAIWIIEVIAGQYEDVKGAASTFSSLHLLNARLNKNAKADFSFPVSNNTGLLVIEGSIRVNESETVPTDHFALFDNNAEQFTVDALEDSIVSQDYFQSSKIQGL